MSQAQTRELMGWCVRCKAQQAMQVTEPPTRMKNGRPAQRGTCSRCGTKMYRILPGH